MSLNKKLTSFALKIKSFSRLLSIRDYNNELCQLMCLFYCSRRASQEMITYTAGEYNPDFVSVLPPEKTKAWHFSSHEKALIRAGIDPRQFSW